MGREVRRVSKDWEHPRDECGNLIPMYDYPPTYTEEEILEGREEGWLTGEPPNYDMDVMPQWEDDERTHYQMYENVSEGTPLSPVMESPEKLARWLADNGANAGAFSTATYDQWLRVCKGGWAPSMVIHNGRMMSGVEGLSDDNN